MGNRSREALKTLTGQRHTRIRPAQWKHDGLPSAPQTQNVAAVPSKSRKTWQQFGNDSRPCCLSNRAFRLPDSENLPAVQSRAGGQVYGTPFFLNADGSRT